MRFFKEREQASENPITWFTNHLGSINNAIYNHYLEVNTSLLNQTNRRLLYRTRLTEQGICNSWHTIAKQVGLPKSFRVIDGTVRQHMIPAQHVFLQSGKGRHAKILCHSAGQFMSSTLTGKRMELLQKKAIDSGRADLVHIIGNFAVVYGEVWEVRKFLGLKYSKKSYL